jgi:predicted pyridoxine 5'-phosphate oxidase superfamily flavin-nucleotide-binding protein
MGRWLLKKVNAALDGYTTAYVQERAKIDARIQDLEKLAKEQARLTRTVESIKDEISAGAKDRDNRWAFRKEIYCELVRVLSDLEDAYHEAVTIETIVTTENPSGQMLQQLDDRRHAIAQRMSDHMQQFAKLARLAPLATADPISSAIQVLLRSPFTERLEVGTPRALQQLQDSIKAIQELLSLLQRSGRNDLWGISGIDAKADSASQS